MCLMGSLLVSQDGEITILLQRYFDVSTLDVLDRGGKAALHYAYRNVRHGTIALLLDEFGVISVFELLTRSYLSIFYGKAMPIGKV